MGIPRFARWMTGKFKGMQQKGDKAPKVVAALYVDMNGLIHPCCHGESPLIAAAPEAEKIRRICAALDELVADTCPTTLLYLAMDGVAPRAKMNQQRARRYSAAAARFPASEDLGPNGHPDPTVIGELARVATEVYGAGAASAGPADELGDFAFIGESPVKAAKPQFPPIAPSDDAFDSNCISPGTVFMERVSMELRKYIEAKLAATSPHWHPELAVVFSDSNVPGEGEHKIIDFMRTNVAQGTLKSVYGAHVIVGLDADLILLGMSLHCPNVYILRDNDRDRTFTPAVEATSPHESDEDEPQPPAQLQNSPQPRSTSPVLSARRKKLEFFDLTVAADSLASEILALAASLLPAPRASAIAATPHRLVDDFIILCTMLGNDFMPRVPSGHCGDGAADNFIEAYVRHVLPISFLSRADGDVDIAALHRWFRAYADVEATLFRQQWCKFANNEAVARAGKFPTDLDRATWMKVYHDTVDLDSQAKIDAACRHFIDGLRFVWRYYATTSAQCSWRWYFPFNHAPLVHDLAQYTAGLTQASLPTIPVQTDAPEPMVQLLCILPPTSCRLLPPQLRPLMVTPTPELASTFPLHWTVDESASGGMEHLFTVMLPFADLDGLQKASAPLIETLQETDRRRNVNSPTYEVLLHRANRSLSQQESGAAQYRWLRAAPCRDAGEVRWLTAKDTIPTTTAKPRQYNVTIPQKFVYSVQKSVLEPHSVAAVQRRWAPNATGLTVGDGLLLCIAFSIVIVLLFCEFSFLVISELIAVGGVAFGILCFLGFCDASDSGCGLQRNVPRDIILDWHCAGCTALNFGRNECCFVCARPFEEKNCSALFSCTIPRNPPNMDADHRRHMAKVGIEVPGWIAAEAKKSEAAAAA